MFRRLPAKYKIRPILPHSLVLVCVLLLCLPPLIVRADIGPKPTMSFDFIWELEDHPTIVEGQLLQCYDTQCADTYVLEELGPQHFTCTQVACDSMAYGYARYNKLVLSFSDGATRESNVFGKKYDRSTYEVTVRPSDLVVTEMRGTNEPFGGLGSLGVLWTLLRFMLGFATLVVFLGISIALIVKTRSKPAIYEDARILFIIIWIVALPALIIGTVFAPTLPLTIVIEGVMISLYTLLKKERWFPWITVVTLGNLLTQTLFLSVAGASNPPILLSIFLEIFIWILEAILIHLTLRRKKSFVGSLGISFMMNFVSMAIGLLLPL
jgi:hypothetical protein